MNLYFSKPLEQRHIAQVYASKQNYISKMNGLYSQAILQQQAMNAVSSIPNTHVSTPVVDKTPEKSTIPNIYTNTSTVSNSSSSSSSNSSSSSGFSISGIISTTESDFSKYFDYILIGGIALFVFYIFSGSSSNKPTKFVDIEIPE